MKAANDIALKEWSVVNRALREGWQVVLLRKGGIAEKDGVFRIDEPEFFIFSTYEHETPEQLQERFKEWPYDAERLRAPAGELDIDTYARVDSIVRVNDLEKLKRALPQTIWSESFLRKRFDYKPEDPLYLVFVRAYRTPHPIRIKDAPEFAGCTSWVTLKEALSPTKFYPVFSPEVFEDKKKKFLTALNAS